MKISGKYFRISAKYLFSRNVIEDALYSEDNVLVGIAVGNNGLVEEAGNEAITTIYNTDGVCLTWENSTFYVFGISTTTAGFNRIDDKRNFSDVTIYKIMVNILPLLIYTKIV